MTAAGAIIGKDWREFTRDRRLMVMAGLVILLALAAVVTSFARVSAYETDRQATERRDRTTWESQGARNPHSVAHFSTWALRPLTPLALLDPGVTPYAGSAIWMEAHNQNPARARAVEDAASAFDLGSFSLAWVLQVIAPLLIFVIAAGTVARERERGTLRLMLASGFSVRAIVPHKALGTVRTASMLVAPVLMIGVIASLILGVAEPLRLVLWIAAYALFLVIVAVIAVAVSALCRSTSQAMLALVSIWLLAMLIAPRAGAAIGIAAAPVPTPDQFFAAMAANMAKQPDVFGDGAAAFGAAMAKRYGVAKVEDLPVSFAGLQLDEGERHGNIVFDRHFGALANTYAAERSAMRWAGLISPLPAVQNVSMALAGTDMAHQLAFQTQAEAHRRKLIGLLNRDMVDHAKGTDFDYRSGPALWRKTADFRFVPPPIGTAIAAIVPDIAILVGWLIAAMALLGWSARRLEADDI